VRRRPGLALRYWRSLPLSRLALALVGVFFIFAAVGFIIASWQIDAPRPWPAVLAQAALSGATAVLFVLVGIRSLWFLPVALVFDILGMRAMFAIWNAAYQGGALETDDLAVMKQRLQVEGMCAIASIAVGWIALARFMRREGARQIRLRTEVDLAHDIHVSLVPPLAFTAAGCEVRGLSLPSTEVGGDLADAYEQEGRLVACVADVAGHGVPAGALMAMIKSAVRLALPARSGLETLLAHLNRILVDLRRPDRFVTLACLRFDGSGAAEYVLAGHFPILRIAAGTRAVERLENMCLPLGVQAEARFTARRVTAAAGDLFVIFTDGLIEVRDAAERELGMERLEALVVEHAARSLADIERLVFGAARRHGRQLDDQTLLLMRVR
jgi:serine phosphatase RsbU (regulator of sigma subunit)